jgi:hypothetical protein
MYVPSLHNSVDHVDYYYYVDYVGFGVVNLCFSVGWIGLRGDFPAQPSTILHTTYIIYIITYKININSHVVQMAYNRLVTG